MAVRWIGNAQAIAQVSTITVANTWATGDLGNIIINGKTLTLTVGAAATTAGVAAALVAMFNGDAVVGTETRNNTGNNIPEFNEITATLSGSTCILTHDTAGVPFTATVSETTAGTGTLAIAATTAASGPSFYNVAANWDGGVVPTTEDVFIDNTDQPITDGLSNAGTTLASLTIGQNVGSNFCIGRPKKNPNGYWEYRGDYLAVDCSSVKIGTGSGQGAYLVKLNLGTVQTAVEVYATGTSREQGLEAVILKGTHASNTLEVHSGSVGVAAYGGEAATVVTVRNSGGTLRLGAGCTLTTVSQLGGSTEIGSAFTTLTVTGGECTVNGSGAITTVTVSNGTFFWNGTGTITTANLNDNGVLDASGDISARTISTLNLNGGRINDPAGVVTLSAIARGTGVREIVSQR